MGAGPEERALVKALQEARDARDRALEQLATARAELEALRLARTTDGEPAPGAFVPEGRPALPLRYRVADAANEAFKGVLGPVQRNLRSLLTRRTPDNTDA